MPKTKKTFEENLEALESLVKNLESGEIPLEEAISSFEKGMQLSKELEDTLVKAEKKLATIMSEKGEVPFESTEEEGE